MEDSLINLVQKILKRNKISFDREELSFQIQSHPSYPSLHAITGVLDHFNIENIAADVPVDAETLHQLPDCFIAQIKDDKGSRLVVVEKKDTHYLVFNTANKSDKLSEEVLLEKFTGIIVAVERSEENQIQTDTSAISTYISLGLLGVFVAFILFIDTSSIYDLSYLVLSGLGVLVSVVVIKQELGLQTGIGDAFCSGIDDKKDCDAVLTSKGAEIIKGFKLSDFSLLYFSALTILTLVQMANPVFSFTISLLAVPITLYSLYYQYVVVKKWCLLCLSIVGVLWLQALIPVLTNDFISEFNSKDIAVFGAIFIVIGLSWKYIKPLVVEIYDLRKEKIAGVKFKRNFTLFDGMLQKSPKLSTGLHESQEIVFGNPNANLEIVVVTNPFCGHCKPVHKQLDAILHKYGQKIKICIRFSINTQDKDSEAVRVTSRLLELYNTNGQLECLQAMGEIYGGEKPAKWLEKWNDCILKDNYIQELDKEHAWCADNAINFTPELLINGQSYPKEYDRSDLVFFIEELEEHCQLEMALVEEKYM